MSNGIIDYLINAIRLYSEASTHHDLLRLACIDAGEALKTLSKKYSPSTFDEFDRPLSDKRIIEEALSKLGVNNQAKAQLLNFWIMRNSVTHDYRALYGDTTSTPFNVYDVNIPKKEQVEAFLRLLIRLFSALSLIPEKYNSAPLEQFLIDKLESYE
jgi:hypothetical protein